MALSSIRHSELLRSVPTNAAKVYEVIPITEGWTYSQIHQEMQRLGHNVRQEVLMGCVVRLKDAGLVYEPTQSRFQRVAYKPKPELKLATPMPQTSPAASVLKPTPADALANLAVQLRAIASTIDDVALAVEEQLNTENEELKKLHQLRDLLKAM